MSNWISLTTADLQDREAAAIITALSSAALGNGQSDPLPGIIQSCVDLIRAHIASCSRNVLDADPTKIPASLRELAVRIILRTAKGRLNLPLENDESQDALWDRQALKDIAACLLSIEAPDTPGVSNIQSSGSMEVALKPTRQASRELLDGLN